MAVNEFPVILCPFPDPDASSEEWLTAISHVRGALENVEYYEVRRSATHVDSDGTVIHSNIDATDYEIARLAGAASARIERYAPNAPDDAKNEALIRLASWIRDARGARFVEGVGEGMNISTPPENQSRAFRLSGAMGLLSQWRVRGAGVVQESTS